MEIPILQVSEFLAVVNQTLDYAYPTVMVEGEVASFKVSKGKFAFFDLKDEQGVVNCFMMAYQIRHPIEDGMRIRITAQPRVTAWGKFSLTVREISPVGKGSIKRAFELLHAKLDKEGLFDPARKRPLPHAPAPAHIGLIASVESAGYVDFLKILDNRWGGVDVQVADVQVQGTGAAEQIIRAIDHFNQQAEVPEVLVIVRGGGSMEDLAVFNDEALVRAVAASRVPTLVGVGHEVDTSLCDMAADLRAATPSNAAQLLVPDRHALIRELSQREHRLFERIESRLKTMRHTVIDAPQLMLARFEAAVVQHRRQVAHAELLLKQLDPKVVLQRGYALIRHNKQLVRGAANKLKAGDVLTITLARAILKAEVTNVERKT